MCRVLLIAVSCLLCLFGTAVQADLKFLTHSLGESTYVGDDGLLHGRDGSGRRAFNVETVVAMMRHLNEHLPIAEVPLSRGFYRLEHEPDIAFFNVIKNDVRQKKYKWVGPISNLKTYFYEHVKNPTGVKTMQDARKVRGVCGVLGNNMNGWLERNGFENVITTNSLKACVQLMEYGRASLVYGTEYQFHNAVGDFTWHLRRTPVSTDDVEGEREATDLGFIAFSPDVPDAEIARWQAALDAIKASGEYARLRDRFLVPLPDQASHRSLAPRGGTD
jgi:polar amino acid transport system substrate-binding protein